MNLKVHYMIYESPPLSPVLTVISPIHTTPFHLSKTQITIIGIFNFFSY
jgi:hypothetical protein